MLFDSFLDCILIPNGFLKRSLLHKLIGSSEWLDRIDRTNRSGHLRTDDLLELFKGNTGLPQFVEFSVYKGELAF